MPIVNRSSKENKQEQRIVLTLQKEQRQVLKDLMKEWEQLNKAMTAPININENLYVKAYVDEPYFFQYQNPNNVRKEKDLNYYLYFYVGEMIKKEKKKVLSNLEELLFTTWNEISESYSPSAFESCIELEPIKGELIKRSRKYCDYQIKLEGFISELSKDVEGGNRLLELIKSYHTHAVESMFKSLIKGDTLEIW